ncbi:hypothetical protein CDD83_7790 [Cordyceps sp. RAO-2017]|nr:hypothetical protein CDD83_7790 [Cordyceps sp. RAO-2017]
MAQAWTRQEKIKTGVWAVACTAVVFVGLLTGAEFKSDRQKSKAIQEFRETPRADQIAILEAQKKRLLQQKAVWDRKVDVCHREMREREAKKDKEGK